MLLFNSNKKYSIGKSTANKTIVLGVAHIKANLAGVLSLLRKIGLSSTDTVFLEPKRSILIGQDKCLSGSIDEFFSCIRDFALASGADILSLNPENMPSHNSSLIHQKYAEQLAEEEYMAGIILERQCPGRKIVVIGNTHAKRMCSLLRIGQEYVSYHQICPPTPDDVLAESWRGWMLGTKNKVIGAGWLGLINREVMKNAGLESITLEEFRELLWQDEEMYSLYVKLAAILMKEYKRSTFEFIPPSYLRQACREIFESAKVSLDAQKNPEEHLTISTRIFPGQSA